MEWGRLHGYEQWWEWYHGNLWLPRVHSIWIQKLKCWGMSFLAALCNSSLWKGGTETVPCSWMVPWQGGSSASCSLSLLPSAIWDTALSPTALIYSELAPQPFWWNFLAQIPYISLVWGGWGLQKSPKRNVRNPQGGHERAESSKMRTRSLEQLPFQGGNYSFKQ